MPNCSASSRPPGAGAAASAARPGSASRSTRARCGLSRGPTCRDGTAFAMPARALHVEQRRYHDSRARPPAHPSIRAASASRLLQGRAPARHSRRARGRTGRSMISPRTLRIRSAAFRRGRGSLQRISASRSSASVIFVARPGRRHRSPEVDDFCRERSVSLIGQTPEPLVQIVGDVAHVQGSHGEPPFLQNVPLWLQSATQERGGTCLGEERRGRWILELRVHMRGASRPHARRDRMTRPRRGDEPHRHPAAARADQRVERPVRLRARTRRGPPRTGRRRGGP